MMIFHINKVKFTSACVFWKPNRNNIETRKFWIHIHICHQKILPFVSIQLPCLNLHCASSLQDYQGQIRHPPNIPQNSWLNKHPFVTEIAQSHLIYLQVYYKKKMPRFLMCMEQIQSLFKFKKLMPFQQCFN
jgi:hypothetical protein